MQEQLNLIYVGGISGVGKTTTCKEVARIDRNLTYVNSGEIKAIEARRRWGKSLFLLDQEESTAINDWFFKYLIKNPPGKTCIIDTHYTYPLRDGSFVRLTPENCVPYLDSLVLVEAIASQILERRVGRGRDRDSINKEFIKVELKEESKEAHRISEKFSKGVYIIKNTERQNRSILEFLAILRGKYKEVML